MRDRIIEIRWSLREVKYLNVNVERWGEPLGFKYYRYRLREFPRRWAEVEFDFYVRGLSDGPHYSY